MLNKIKTEAKIKKKQLPYIYEYFNISCFTPNPQSFMKNVLTKLVNCVIKALNDTNKLPRIILIVPDSDLLRYIDYDDHGIKEVTKGAVEWITTQIVRAVDAKKDFLMRRKPGAVIASEPKIIWVKMIDRVNGRSSLLALRSKYNEAMEDVLSNNKNHYVMDINAEIADTTYLDQFNQLNDYGKTQYWVEIDKQIELFEKRKITLKPSPAPEVIQDPEGRTNNSRTLVQNHPTIANPPVSRDTMKQNYNIFYGHRHFHQTKKIPRRPPFWKYKQDFNRNKRN